MRMPVGLPYRDTLVVWLKASPNGLAASATPANTVNSRDRPRQANALKFIIALPNEEVAPALGAGPVMVATLNYSRAAVPPLQAGQISMAEAGRECSQPVRPQQLSLFNHRESNYTTALERRFFVTRHTLRAHPIRDSLNRWLLRTAAKSASRANVGRYAAAAAIFAAPVAVATSGAARAPLVGGWWPQVSQPRGFSINSVR